MNHIPANTKQGNTMRIVRHLNPIGTHMSNERIEFRQMETMNDMLLLMDFFVGKNSSSFAFLPDSLLFQL